MNAEGAAASEGSGEPERRRVARVEDLIRICTASCNFDWFLVSTTLSTVQELFLSRHWHFSFTCTSSGHSSAMRGSVQPMMMGQARST